MRSPVHGYLLVAALALAVSPLEAQIVPRRIQRDSAMLAQPPAPTGVTLSRFDDAAPPRNLRAAPTWNSVSLTWSASADANSYVVLRSATAPGPFEAITPAVADTQFTDTGVIAGATYFYQVTASRPDGHFGTSDPVTVTVPVEKTVLRERPTPVFKALDTPSTTWGFADLHAHQIANLAYGGGLFWGEAYGDPNVAIKPCDPAHGWGGTQDVVGNVMRGKALDHHTGGAPNFDGWPTYNTLDHQQMYVDWLKRAVDGGLRLMVMDAVNNGLLCELAPKKGPRRSCNDMEAVRLQVEETKKVEQYVDNANGGEGQGWYRIVYSAREARDAITSGKLAVVLGIEVDKLFNCDNSCSPQQVRDRLQAVYDMGVRKLIPVHLADNAFGGSALYSGLFQFNNLYANKKFFDAFDCSDRGIEYRFDPVGDASMQIARTLIGGNGAVLQSLGLAGYTSPPAPTVRAQCNVTGLTTLGSFLIHEMMSKHMIIDVAHLGLRAFESTLAITDSSDYPVVASHSSLLDVGLGEKRSERALSNAQIAAIRKNGGLIGIGLGGGNANEMKGTTRILNDCGHSSKSFAQSYLTTVDRVRGEPVAFGSDMNGMEVMSAPRFGSEACAGDKSSVAQPPATMVGYPFTGYRTGNSFDRMRFGNRTFDFNTDGFAQVGMYPDFIEDLQKVGVTGNELDPLFRSADAFVRLWEKAESKNLAPLAIAAPPPTLAVAVIPQPSSSDAVRRLVVTAKDRQTGAAKNGTVSIFATGLSGTTVTGQTGQLLSYAPCRRAAVVTAPASAGGGRERDIVESCGGRVSVAGYPDASFTAP